MVPRLMLTAPTITLEPGDTSKGARNSCKREGGEENLAGKREGALMKHPVLNH